MAKDFFSNMADIVLAHAFCGHCGRESEISIGIKDWEACRKEMVEEADRFAKSFKIGGGK